MADDKPLPNYGNLSAPSTVAVWISQGTTIHLVFIDMEVYTLISDGGTYVPPPDVVIANARYVYSMNGVALTHLLHACVDRTQELIEEGKNMHAYVHDPLTMRGARRREALKFHGPVDWLLAGLTAEEQKRLLAGEDFDEVMKPRWAAQDAGQPFDDTVGDVSDSPGSQRPSAPPQRPTGRLWDDVMEVLGQDDPDSDQ